MNRVQPDASSAGAWSDVLIAQSGCMLELLEEVVAFAGSDHNVVIQGETGVGKELVAKLLHQRNCSFRNGPFVAVNCGAIPEGLFESLFFGHVRGAFTGALQNHRGYLEQANGGTLFMDEVGDLPLLQQVKLLRVLQNGSVTPVGSETPVALKFRLVTATHHDLRQMVMLNSFRADLFYRLAVIEIRVPNLEERGPLDKLAIFEKRLRAVLGDGTTVAGNPTPDWLASRVVTTRFSGNVRQLHNLAERVGVIVRQLGRWDTRMIERALSQVELMSGPTEHTHKSTVYAKERLHILETLKQNNWQRQATAASLGMSRKSLWEKMGRYGLADDDEPHSGENEKPSSG